MYPPAHMTNTGIDAPLGGGPCVVLRDPLTDHKCGAPSTGKRILENPICNTCYEAVRL